MPLPTVQSVLELTEVRTGRPEVLAGHDALDVPVRWVHVSEVRDVAALLSGGELILSTGLAMQGRDADAVDYLDDLIDSHAVALAIELGPAFPRIPDECVERARARQFPLIALHRKTRFVQITERVHREIVAEQFDLLAFSQRVHERLTALSLEGADAQSIVAATAELSESPVVLEDVSRRVAAYATHSTHSTSARDLLRDWEQRSRLAPSRTDSGLSGPEGWLTTPVGIQQRWGRLVLVNPNLPEHHPSVQPPATNQPESLGQPRQARLSMVVERAAQALELGRMAERDNANLAMQAQAGFVSDLADSRIGDPAEIEVRARALGLALTPPYAAVVVRAPHVSPRDPLAQHRRTRRLVERVNDAARVARLPVLVGGFGQDDVAVICALGNPHQRKLDGFARSLHEQHDRHPELDKVTIAAGEVLPSLLDATSGLHQVRQIAQAAASMPPGRSRTIFRAADIRLHGLIAVLHEDPRVQAFVESELSNILVHEAAHNDGSLDLLRRYLAANGNKTELALSSHRSRPALYKRLARLEEILGARLDDPDTRIALGVALLAYDQRTAARAT